MQGRERVVLGEIERERERERERGCAREEKRKDRLYKLDLVNWSTVYWQNRIIKLNKVQIDYFLDGSVAAMGVFKQCFHFI